MSLPHDHNPRQDPPRPNTVLTVLQAQGAARPSPLADLSTEVRWATPATLPQLLPGTQVLFIQDLGGVAGLAENLAGADALTWVHSGNAGVDALQGSGLDTLGIPVTNARGVFDRAMAEYVATFVLQFAKDVPSLRAAQAAHRWDYRVTRGVKGTRALVVGVGSIGREIARMLGALGIECTGAGTRARPGDDEFAEIVDSGKLAEHVAGFDWIVNVAPLTPATTGLIDARVLRACSPHAVFLNVGRGRSVVTDDLVEALEQGWIAGAVLDVVDPEPLPADHRLWDAPGAVITPHMSGDLDESPQLVIEQFIDNWRRFHSGRELRNPVDIARGYAAG